MKLLHTVIFLCCFLQQQLLSQEVYDFESPAATLTFQYFGSSLEPQLTSVVNNPLSGGINTSSQVGKYIRAAGAQVWAGGFANPAPATPFDATSGGKVCIKVLTDHAGNVALKLEQPVGGGENWITTQNYTTPNEWAELCFDLTAPSLEDSKLPAAGKSFGQVVLFFDFLQPSPGADVTFYFDDITRPKQEIVITSILDFETAESSTNFTYFGSPLDGQSTQVIDNPNPSGINNSSKVSKFTKPAVAEVWAGAYSNPNPTKPINLSTGSKVCIKVHMDHIGNLALKLEGSTSGKPNWIQKVSNTKINEWEELCFDASLPSLEAPFEPANSVYERAVLFFDFGTPGTGTDVNSYFDDLVTKSGGAPPVRTLNFKVNMNNYTASFDKVYISGSFNGWSGDANPLQDADEDGIWEGTLKLNNGAYEYKITLDNWAKQEAFLGTEECTKTTDAFTNRLLLVSGDANIPEFCYNSCYACGEEVAITFRLGMGNVTPSPEGVWIAGGGNFDVPGGRYKMQDPDGDKVYEIVVPRKNGFSSYFTFANGPCPDYSCKENIEGLSCANPNNFNDRFIGPVGVNTTYSSCFGLCSDNVGCTSSSTESTGYVYNFSLLNNPSGNGLIALDFGQNVPAQYVVRITDLTGKVNGEFRINSGRQTEWIDIQTLPSGLHYITTFIGGDSQTMKFIKL
jgi:hypothetical protein